MVKTKEIKDQSVEELRAIYYDLSKEIFQLRNENKLARKVDKPHLVRAKKKDRARALTFLRQKGGSITN